MLNVSFRKFRRNDLFVALEHNELNEAPIGATCL